MIGPRSVGDRRSELAHRAWARAAGRGFRSV